MDAGILEYGKRNCTTQVAPARNALPMMYIFDTRIMFLKKLTDSQNVRKKKKHRLQKQRKQGKEQPDKKPRKQKKHDMEL